MKRLLQVDFLTMMLFTSWGLLNGSVTVFYIIYLFLLQEVIRTIIDTGYSNIISKKLFNNYAFKILTFSLCYFYCCIFRTRYDLG